VLDLARETGGAVKVTIIGTGRMGKGFATALAPKHHVTVGSWDPDRARKVASATGAARGAGYTEAAADAEVVILTVPWNAIEETLRQLGELNQTVVIDVSFPYRKSEREALLEKGSSTAEQIQQRVPRARVVKGWNHVHAQHLTAPVVDGIAASVLVAGDDPAAKEIVVALVRDMGFHPVDVGPLKASRELERLVGMMLFVRLGPLRVLSPS
jgi:8-hydroxy-5-deazaflavin:NADPH oxidoreductase